MSTTTSWAERQRLSVILLDNLKEHSAEIDELAARFSEDEYDCYYRLYHFSFKVFVRQQAIRNAVALFESLAPEQRAINRWFTGVIGDALKQTFEMQRTNRNWLAECRPIVEAWSHCHIFLKALSRSAHDLPASPRLLPDHWALSLYLFDCR